MSYEKIAAEALRLSLWEMALLASSWLESLTDPYANTAEVADDASIALARERDHRIETGEVRPMRQRFAV